jgi:Protein of unknown function (DUF2849)
MAKAQPPQILTANRLRTGAVVYWQRGGWVERLTEADVFFGSVEADDALAQARQFVTDRVVVNPYLFAVAIGDGESRPIEEREIIRAAGPTVRTDTGKQAHPRHV